MPTLLESLTADLDRKSVGLLGDTFTFQSGSDAPVTGALGFVDYAEDIIPSVSSAPGVVAQVITIELLAELFPEKPTEADRISDLDRYPGVTWKPVGTIASDKGFWRFSIKKVV